jgi:hypothetical protein
MVAESLRWTTRDLDALPNHGGLRHEIGDPISLSGHFDNWGYSNLAPTPWV